MRSSSRGSVMIVVALVVLVLGAMVAAYSIQATSRDSAVETYQDNNHVFNLAEVALNEAIFRLNENFDGIDNNGNGAIDEANEGNPDIGTSAWNKLTDDTNGNGLPDFGEPNVVPVSSGGGSYWAYVQDWSNDGVDDNFNGTTDEAAETSRFTITAFARIGQLQRQITVVVAEENVNVWNNAIFAGSGIGSTTIKGNALIHGSVHLLGTGLAATDFAMNMNGTSGIRNNYTGIDATIAAKIPALTGDLDTKLRVLHGIVGLSGTATVGDATLEVDGVYVNDGYGGNKGTSNVYSANGVDHQYDIPTGLVTFPDINAAYTDPSTGTSYSSYKAYFSGTSAHVNTTTLPGWTGTINKNTSSFTITSGTNSIVWNQTTKILTVTGKVTFDGDVTLGGTGGSATDITYVTPTTGGTLMSQPQGAATGTVSVVGNLLPQSTFPTSNVLGIMAVKDINISSTAQLKAIAAFYAGNKITSAKQNEIGGTFVANTVDMGSNVPRIYQVPALVKHLPPGMIGSGSIILFTRLSWRENE